MRIGTGFLFGRAGVLSVSVVLFVSVESATECQMRVNGVLRACFHRHSKKRSGSLPEHSLPVRVGAVNIERCAIHFQCEVVDQSASLHATLATCTLGTQIELGDASAGIFHNFASQKIVQSFLRSGDV